MKSRRERIEDAMVRIVLQNAAYPIASFDPIRLEQAYASAVQIVDFVDARSAPERDASMKDEDWRSVVTP